MAKKSEQSSENMAIDIALKEIETAFGPDAVIRMDQKPCNIEVIPSSSIYLNRALGIGGFPRGRIVEITGQEATGKTTLAIDVLINAQRKFPGEEVLIVDSEYSLNQELVENMGLNLSGTLLSQPSCAEEALDIIEKFLVTNRFSAILLDSIAGLVPRVELENGFDEQQVGVLPRLMSKAMRKYTGLVSKTSTCLILNNQERDNIGVMGYGPKKSNPGGNAIKFHSSIILDIRRKEKIKNASGIIGVISEATVKKNKLAPPFRTAELNIMFGMGIIREMEIIELGIEYGLIKKGGAGWFEVEGHKIQSKDKLVKFLVDNEEIRKHIEEEVMAHAY